MDGVEVMLLDRAPYTARCWDDDRVWINLPLFGEEPDGGAERARARVRAPRLV